MPNFAKIIKSSLDFGHFFFFFASFFPNFEKNEVCRKFSRTFRSLHAAFRQHSGSIQGSVPVPADAACAQKMPPLLASSCARPSRPLSATSRSRRHEVRCLADSSVKLLQQSNLALSRSGHFARSSTAASVNSPAAKCTAFSCGHLAK